MVLLTKLTDDLNIIALLDNEPNDIGGLSAEELKAKFDEGSLIIQKYINETLLPELAGENGAANVGIATVPALTGVETVQAALEKIEQQMAEMTQGAVADGSITSAKLTDKCVTAAKLADNSVGSAAIIDLAILTAKLADKVVTAAKLADKAVIRRCIGDKAVGNAQLGEKCVGSSNIDDLAVPGRCIMNNAVTSAKLAADAKDIILTNVAVALDDFAEDATNEDYGIKCTITASNATAAMIPEIVFTDAIAEEIRPSRTAQTADGVITFNCENKPEAAITIPTIILRRPGSVGSAGSGTSAVYETYSGTYKVEPAAAAQTLETKNKLLDDDIDISAVPLSTTSNSGGGKTVSIGG